MTAPALHRALYTIPTSGQLDVNAVARRYTELCESLRQPARAIGELTRRVPLALEVQRLVIAVTFE
jgi:hypothetical protein